MLAKDRNAIEAVVGEKLNWNPHPDKKVKTIKLTQPMRLVDRSTWPAATAWLTQTAVKFREAFAQRILDLDIKSLRLPPGHEESQ